MPMRLFTMGLMMRSLVMWLGVMMRTCLTRGRRRLYTSCRRWRYHYNLRMRSYNNRRWRKSRLHNHRGAHIDYNIYTSLGLRHKSHRSQSHTQYCTEDCFIHKNIGVTPLLMRIDT